MACPRRRAPRLDGARGRGEVAALVAGLVQGSRDPCTVTKCCDPLPSLFSLLALNSCAMSQKATVFAVVLWLLLVPLSCEQLLEQAQRYYCTGPCPSGGATASLTMALSGPGAHRQLVYRLAVQHPPDRQSSNAGAGDGGAGGGSGRPAPPPVPACEAVLLQPLPAGIFADIYQLDNAAAVGQGPQVKLFGPVDVESIERYSQPTVLAVRSTLSSSVNQSSSTAGAASATAATQVTTVDKTSLCGYD